MAKKKTLREQIPNLDKLFNKVVEFVKLNQGEKGYIDCQPSLNGDIIYCFVYDDFSSQGEERIVYGVRVKDNDLEICFEQSMRTYTVVYDEHSFNGKYEDEEANAKWYSVRWSDVYYIPTLFNIAECIEEYA